MKKVVATDWKEVVESDEIDLIDICYPNNMHREFNYCGCRERTNGF